MFNERSRTLQARDSRTFAFPAKIAEDRAVSPVPGRSVFHHEGLE